MGSFIVVAFFYHLNGQVPLRVHAIGDDSDREPLFAAD